MKRSKVIPPREAWLVDMRPHPVTPDLGVACLVGAVLVLGLCSIAVTGRLAHASPPNLVTIPAYSDTHAADEAPEESSQPEFKYQYEPVNDEKPILHIKTEKREVVDGAEYGEGDELVVEPESGDLAVSPARLIDKDGEGEEPTSAPSPSPSPDPMDLERYIAKRAAEVR